MPYCCCFNTPLKALMFISNCQFMRATVFETHYFLLTVHLQVPLVLHGRVVQGHILGAAGQVASIVVDRWSEAENALGDARVVGLLQQVMCVTVCR
jgi:hypothetical protein